MRGFIIKLYSFAQLIGLDPRAFVHTVKTLPFFYRDLAAFKKQKGNDKTFAFARAFPKLKERFSQAGKMSGHYFHQDLLVARKIFQKNPKRHVDVGSRTDGFVAHVAVFREIELLDIRDMVSKVENIRFRKADLMKLPQGMENYCDSVSALHSIEHFGLGRYGDPIDYNGHLKAIENITRMLISDGTFYFSVPIGQSRIEFNAHRVFSVAYLLDVFKANFSIVSFSYVNDKGDLFENVELSQPEVDRNFNCRWGCGIFELIKK